MCNQNAPNLRKQLRGAVCGGGINVYGGLFVPFRYFVLPSFRLALWRGAKTK